MTSLTIAIDEELLRQARIRALEQGTSVNALLRDFLERLVDPRTQQRKAIQAIHELAEQSHSGSRGRRWTRDSLYDRRTSG